MKLKLLRIVSSVFVSLALFTVRESAFAQGTLNFSNNGNSLVYAVTWAEYSDILVFSDVPVPANGGFVELLWAPVGTASIEYSFFATLTQWLSANPGWQAIESSITPIGPVAGRFLGGTVTVPTATPGAPIQARVAAWMGNYATFDSAVWARGFGAISEGFFVQTGNPNITPPGVPAVITGPNGFRGIPAPEPAAAALVVLALLLWRSARPKH
jgi:hypothetical protein